MSECLHGEHWMWELRHAGVNRIKVLLLPSTCTPLGLVQTLSSSSFQWLHVVLRVFCSVAQPNREGMKQREGSWSCRPGEGHLHSDRHQPAPGFHLSPACKMDHVFTLHRCTWSVRRQTHPLYLKVKAAHSYICVGLGFCANAALVHHYSSPVENGLGKVITP